MKRPISPSRLAVRPRLSVLWLFIGVGLLAGACGNDDGGNNGNASSDTGTEAATTLDAASPSTPAAAAAFTKVKAAGKLTVCSDIPYAPFEFERDGKVVGVDIDLVTAIGKQLGLEATFVDTDFDGIFASLAAGNCDMIASSVSITEERKQQNDFSSGYFKINQSLLVRKGDETTINDLPALRGKVVAAQSSTTGAEFAKGNAEANGFTVKEFTGADEMFTALKAKQVDAVLQDFPINSYNAVATGETVVSKVFTGGTEEYGFVIPKSNPELTAAVNTALESLRAGGEYDRIITVYLSSTGQ